MTDTPTACILPFPKPGHRTVAEVERDEIPVTRLSLPWPPASLLPNAKRRTHWSAYTHAAKVYRKQCGWLTKQARIRVDPGLVPIVITFHPPDRRRRDDDGMIGAFKHGRDGFADALGIDDHVLRPTYQIAEPVKDGLVVIELVG